MALTVAECEPIDGLALSQYDTCSFSVSILKGDWKHSKPSSLFESGCLPYTGDLITLRNLPTDDSVTVLMGAFGDGFCQEKIVLGVRGGIQPVAAQEPGSIWYIPTFRVGGFSTLPVFRPDQRDAAQEVFCTQDSDCRSTDGDGNYVLSPVAKCNIDQQQCVLPDSLYPLNQSARRAFHSATALDNGDVVLVGGLSEQRDNSIFLATKQTVELFDPATITWKRIELPGLSGIRVAMHSAIALGDNRLGIFGGAKEISLRLENSALRPHIAPKANTLQGIANLNGNMFVVDMAHGDVTTAALAGGARVGTHAARVDTADGPRVLVSGGSVPSGDGVVPSESTDLCDVGSNKPSCAVVGLNKARTHHCGFCLDSAPSFWCKKYFVFGGLSSDIADGLDHIIGEVYGDEFDAVIWGQHSPDNDDINVAYPGCVRSGNNLYLTGGTEVYDEAPTIAPQRLIVPTPYQQVSAVALENADDTPQVFRIHHASTALNNGRVLVTGGIDDEGNAVDTAYIAQGNKIVGQFNMAEPRFGHTATLITIGALKGAVLIAGGATINKGNIRLVEGAEIFHPIQ